MAKVGGSTIPAPFDRIFSAARRNADQFNMKYMALVAMSEKTGSIIAESCMRGTGEALKKKARTRAENLRQVIRGEVDLDEDRRLKVDFMTNLLSWALQHYLILMLLWFYEAMTKKFDRKSFPAAFKDMYRLHRRGFEGGQFSTR